ncbi:unnamed protein product, partial [Scytosiphon promiscuus]
KSPTSTPRTSNGRDTPIRGKRKRGRPPGSAAARSGFSNGSGKRQALEGKHGAEVGTVVSEAGGRRRSARVVGVAAAAAAAAADVGEEAESDAEDNTRRGSAMVEAAEAGAAGKAGHALNAVMDAWAARLTAAGEIGRDSGDAGATTVGKGGKKSGRGFGGGKGAEGGAALPEGDEEALDHAAGRFLRQPSPPAPCPSSSCITSASPSLAYALYGSYGNWTAAEGDGTGDNTGPSHPFWAEECLLPGGGGGGSGGTGGGGGGGTSSFSRRALPNGSAGRNG